MITREEWLIERKKGIGGSDISAILGLNKWKTPLAVYLDKRGESPDAEDNEPMFWGRTLEPIVRDQYAARTGYNVNVPDKMYHHPEHDWMLANLDGIVQEDGGRVVEIKTARTAEGWGVPGTDAVPYPYLLQVQWYMAVCNVPVADIAVLIGGSDFRIYEIHRDDELIEMMIDRATEFWTMVQEGVPPEPVTLAEVKERFGGSSTAGEVIAPSEIEDLIQELRCVRMEMKQLEADEDRVMTVILRHMGEKESLVDLQGTTLATWKAPKLSKKFDAKSFAVDHAELHQKYMKESAGSRRFLLK